MRLPTTTGAASCPLNTPFENVQASLRRPAFVRSISSSELYRVFCQVPVAIGHSALVAATAGCSPDVAGPAAVEARCGKASNARGSQHRCGVELAPAVQDLPLRAGRSGLTGSMVRIAHRRARTFAT